MSKAINLQNQIRDLSLKLADSNLTDEERLDIEDQIADLEQEIEDLYNDEHTAHNEWN